jgi:hypothetical protein
MEPSSGYCEGIDNGALLGEWRFALRKEAKKFISWTKLLEVIDPGRVGEAAGNR